jgi:hypothetical protein
VNSPLVTTLAETDLGGTEQLARFFPGARPVGLPTLLALRRGGSVSVREAVVVDYAGAERAIFSSALPLEFDDHIQFENDRGQKVEAKVIAVQYQQGKTAVAVQILSGQSSWIKRP